MSPTDNEATPSRSGQAVAEAIASRDLNNLYRTSRLFRDRARYRAFCAYYSLMRVVDDRIDGLPSRLGLSARARRDEHEVVSAWSAAVSCCYQGQEVPPSIAEASEFTETRELCGEFAKALDVIRPPELLWTRFFRAMHWDLDHARFNEWNEFLEYAEGASVAPTTIYLYLIAAKRGVKGGTIPEGFDIIACGRHLGRFAYLGHIVRDLAEDLQLGDRGLVYVPADVLSAFGVTEEMLFADHRRGESGRETRRLVGELVARARAELSMGRSLLTGLSGRLDLDCELILSLIIATYESVLDKIERHDFDVMGQHHRLTHGEKESLLSELTERSGNNAP